MSRDRSRDGRRNMGPGPRAGDTVRLDGPEGRLVMVRAANAEEEEDDWTGGSAGGVGGSGGKKKAGGKKGRGRIK